LKQKVRLDARSRAWSSTGNAPGGCYAARQMEIAERYGDVLAGARAARVAQASRA
jgi:hypothetical protein